VKFLNRLLLTDTLEGFGNGSGQSAANDGYSFVRGNLKAYAAAASHSQPA